MAQETAPPCGPVSRGDSPIIEKMEKRTCALCPEGHEWSQIYFSPSGNIVAHENCLLYSSGLVECETLDLRNTIRNFDVKSVKKEIWRGRRLKCSFCNKGGATVGCDLWFCKKSYHYVCAKKDQAILQVDGNHGTYKLFCPEHSPEQEEVFRERSLSRTLAWPLGASAGLQSSVGGPLARGPSEWFRG